MALEGSINTPLGPVQKKTAALVGGAAVVIAGVVYLRNRQNNAASVPEESIDPATGYAYGSPEDAAALAEQASYVTPADSSGLPGGGAVSTPGAGFVNNAQWTQAVLAAYGNQSDTVSTSGMIAALGVYLAGRPPTADQKSLIQQAIALEGQPPVPGPGGFPPNINTASPVTPPVTMKAPTGLKVSSTTQTTITVDWQPLTGVIGYRLYVNGKQNGNAVVFSSGTVRYLKAGTKYTVGVSGIYPGDKNGPQASISATTKK